jgi:predicted ATPase
MKLFAVLLLSVFLSKSCESQNKNDLKTAVLEYTANTRGFYQKITIQDQMVSVSKDRSGTDKLVATKISEKDWKELVEYFETINLDSLPKLKAPTEKRFHDGAAIADLKVVYKDKTYQTVAFDHGYPPEAIKKIVTKINSFAKKE